MNGTSGLAYPGPRRYLGSRRHSIATVALGGTLGDKLAAAAAAGFDGVELFEPDLIAAPLAPEEVRRRLADLGMTLELYQPLRDVEANQPGQFQRKLRMVRAKFDLMERLGARMALLCSNVSPDAVDDDDLAAEQLAAVADEAQSRGLKVAYEALAWGARVSDYPHSWRIVACADHPALGVCLDSFHILARGTGLDEIAGIPAGKLFMLQLADAPRLRMDELQWSRHHRCFPGQGAFDLVFFLDRVLAAGYDGPLSLEVFNDVFRQADPFRTAIDGRRSLLWLEDRVSDRPPVDQPAPREPATASAPRPSAPASRPEERSLPAAADPRGFAFIEFHTPAQDAQASERLLAGLGFTRTGQHRTKPVELWEAGDARILLNGGRPRPGGPEQFAVAAVGLDVDDAESAALRASALRAPLVPRHRKWDEADFTGIEAPDGIEIFLCERSKQNERSKRSQQSQLGEQSGRSAREDSWLNDFDPCPGESPFRAKTRLTGIDHVELAQPLTLFHETVLFYRSVLRLAPLEAQELASPYGLIRSQALAGGTAEHAGGAGVRFVINVPALGGGRPGSRLVQHVAIQSPDIVETARAVSAQGLAVLQIPGNYYEDLGARHALDEASLNTYRRYNILYDQDSAGHAFRHFCVTMPQGGVLFEIVDREPGYEGYGAGNAAVRMTAQESR